MKPRRLRPASVARPVHVLAASLTISSTLLALRVEAAQPKSPFRVGTPQRSWLGQGETGAPALAVAPARTRAELFFIDGAVADPHAFWLAAPAGASVVCLPAGADPWEFMADEASRFRGLAAIHIISHGEPGALQLNGQSYTAAEIDARPALLRRLGQALSKNGDILLYGCDTGAGAEGGKLVSSLAELTGADVAGSANPTGGREGADWALEIVRGEVEATPLAPDGYEHVLASFSVNSISSLRTALTTAASNGTADTITIAGGITAIGTGDMVTGPDGKPTFVVANITDGQTLTIDGGGNTLDAGHYGRVLYVQAGTVNISNLTITKGLLSGNGGNSDNAAATNARGAGIFNAGTLQLSGVTVTANKAAGGGGGGGASGFGGGGGGGGGFGGIGGGTGGSSGSGSGTYAGDAGSGGTGGRGGSYDGVNLCGFGGGSSGGAGGTAGGASYSSGGAGATASNGSISIGGGGGGSGYTAVGGAGGPGAGGIFNSGTLTIIGSSAITNNLGAGGGGGGGGGLAYGFDGGAGGRGVGGIWSTGTLRMTSSVFFGMSGNAGASGSGGLEQGSGSTGTVPTAQNNILNDGGTLDTNYAAADSDGAVTASAILTEPSSIATTATSSGTAVGLLDFTIADGGTADGLALTISQVDVAVSGTTSDAERGLMVFLLNGPDATNVQGSYNSTTDRVSFSGLSLSIANGGSEDYTVSAYVNDNTSSNDLTDGNTLILSVDGDTHFTVGSSGTQMAASQTAVTNGSGAAIDVTATQLAFATQPAGSVSGSALTTQPVVRATDARGNIDTGFTGNVTLSESSSGALSGTNPVAASAGVATFTNLAYAATADQQTFALTTSNSAGLTNATSSTVTSDVVATALAFSTQPAPTGLADGVSTAFTTVPVLSAVNGSGIVDTGYATAIALAITDPNDGTVDGTVNSFSGTGDTDGSATTVTLTPSSGVATFSGLALQYINGGGTTNTIAFRATSGSLTSANSTSLTVTSDTTPPTASSVSASTANGTYKVGDTISIQVSFDEAVFVTGTPTLALNSGGTASYASGSGTSTLTFSYTVGAGDSAADLDYSATSALALAGGTIKDAAGNNATLTLPSVGGGSSLGGQKAIVIDGVAPGVSSTTVPANATYAAGQNLDFTVTYAEAVAVNTGGGSPYVAVTLSAGGTVQAAYVSGSGTTTLTFRYTIASGNADSDGIAVASSVTLNGGTIRDAAGNNAATADLSFASTASVLVDGIAPSVSAINRGGTTPTNATSIDYSVTFSEAVSGVDTSDFALTTTGTAAGSVASVSAVNASTYTVTVNTVSGDGTLRLDLKASGTGISDTPGNAISGGFTTGQTYTLDQTSPAVSSVGVPANGTYVAGQNLDFTVNLSENVTVNTGGGTPRLALTLATGGTVYASYLSGSGTNALVFRYTVQSGNLDGDGVSVGGSIDANGGTLRDAAGNNTTLTLNSVGSTAGVLVDAVAPTVSSVSVPASGTYITGQNLDFTVNLSENVTVNTGGGTPRIAVTLATGGTVYASYLSGSGTSALVFRYTIQSGNLDGDGIALGSAIEANGGTLRDVAGNNAALALNSVGATTGVLVDGIAPSVSSINRVGSTPTNATSIDFTVTFSEGVSGVDTGDFALTTTGTAAGMIASVSPVSGSTYTVTVNTISGDGTLRVDLKSSGTGIADTAGNALSGGFTSGQTYTVDTIAPSAPVIVSMSTDTGASSSDGVTSDTTPTFSGTAEADSTVEVFRDATWLGTTTADGSGNWALTAATQTNGSYSITATATDAAGNTSEASNVFQLTIDTSEPAAPAVVAITSDSGASGTDRTTNDDTLILSGTAAADASIEVFRDGSSIGTTTATGSGAWSFDYTGTTLDDGTYTFTATAVDAAGNTSGASSPFNVTIDKTAPAKPVFTAISDDTGSSSADQVTSDTRLVLSGTAEANSTITVSRIGTGVLGTATADGSGAWSYDYTGTTLAAGDHTFTATATDAAGNISTVSESFLVTVDVSTPSEPAITAISNDTGADPSDGITNDPTLVFSGTSEANGTVTISRSGIDTPLGTATADGTGAWSYDYTATALAEGSYLFTATTTDAAGNASSASADFPVTIDTTAPEKPAITALGDDTGASEFDGITSDPQIVLGGTAEPEATVEILRNGTPIGTSAADSDGVWTFDYTLNEGAHTLTATATDAAGNTSLVSEAFKVTIDITAPAAPTITAISDDTGSSSSDRITSDPTLVLSGTAEADGTVTISHSVAGVLGTATADGTGAWTFDYSGTTLVDGSHTFTATATDAAGNTGPVSDNFVVTIDTAAPVMTSAATASGSYKSAFGGYTATASGAATSFGATGLPAGLSIDAGTGVISGTPAQSGDFTVTLSATDAAGNTGTATLTLSVAKTGLTVSGVAVVSKIYDGTAAATLDFSSASLVGVFTGDGVALVTSGATGSYATTNAGTGIVVTVSGLTLSGADAAHYTLTQPSTTGSITQAAATVVLASLSQTYDGTPKSATATTTPAGLTVGFTYDGSSTAPTDAGSYAVVGTISDVNYAGSASGTLTIAKADQTVTFTPVASVTVGAPVTLNATASSGLGVALTLISGDATLVGTTLTVASATSDVVVQASQAGDANYNAGSGTLTIPVASITKLTQTITFAEPIDRPATSEPVTLGATASSGLPVSFSLVSGPATLSGNTLTLTARTGVVVVTASQPGNDTYDPAPDVTRQFRVVAVGPQVFFGSSDEGDTVAGNISQDDAAGAIIGYIARVNRGFVFNFKPGADGSFSGPATTFEGNDAAAAQVSVSAMRAEGEGEDAGTAPQKKNGDVTVTIARATEGTFTITGTVVDGVLTGTIVELGIAFTLDMQSQTGPSADVAGYYTAPTLDTADGHVYSIVGTQNTVYVLAVTSEVIVSGTAPLADDYTFALAPTAEISLAGQLGSEEQTVTGAITIAGVTSSFLGTSSTTTRTDRLLNLSSRAQVGATGEQTLIAGFVIGGSGPKTVLLRAVGPALAKLGVANPLAAPRLRLFDRNGRLLREVAGWGGDTTLASTFESVGAFAYDTNSQDAALVATLAPGVYTMHLTGDGATGVALAEIYDTSATSTQQRLLNISSRGNVSGGESVLIGGFVVGGNAPKRVLIRGVGPGLAAYGVGAPLANPTLTLYSGGDVIARNDNWETPVVVNDSQTAATASELADAATATGAFALTSGSTDAALIVTLAPGPYTVHVGSGSGTTGIALVEVYEIPE